MHSRGLLGSMWIIARFPLRVCYPDTVAKHCEVLAILQSGKTLGPEVDRRDYLDRGGGSGIWKVAWEEKKSWMKAQR